MIKNMVVKFTITFPWYWQKLLPPKRSIPALQKADTAWKILYQIPFRPYSGIKTRE